MYEFEEFEGGQQDGTVFRDVIMLALLGFMTIVVMLLPHINPPTQAAGSIEPPGNVIVEVRWPDKLDTDVDLWIEAPGSKPVGYSNKSGHVFNLLRDDLGGAGDPTGLNYEVAYSRGIPSGAYTVNLHLYSDKSQAAPIAATVVVSVKRDSETAPKQIASKEVRLQHLGQELTVVRFELDQSGALVAGSMHDLPRKLRSDTVAMRQ